MVGGGGIWWRSLWLILLPSRIPFSILPPAPWQIPLSIYLIISPSTLSLRITAPRRPLPGAHSAQLQAVSGHSSSGELSVSFLPPCCLAEAHRVGTWPPRKKDCTSQHPWLWSVAMRRPSGQEAGTAQQTRQLAHADCPSPLLFHWFGTYKWELELKHPSLYPRQTVEVQWKGKVFMWVHRRRCGGTATIPGR